LQVNFTHVCDYASVSQNGKLSVNGIFSNLFALSFPANHPLLYLAFEVGLVHAESGQPIKVRIELVDADGEKIMQAEANLDIPRQGTPGMPLRVPQILALAGLQFRKPGPHSFNIFLNDHLGGQAAFDVGQAPSPQTPDAAPGLRR
jgi:hypothetical protein